MEWKGHMEVQVVAGGTYRGGRRTEGGCRAAQRQDGE